MNYSGAFKNYRSQLNGWALAQAIDGVKAKAFEAPATDAELFELADSIAAYAYVAETDFEDMVKRLGDIIKACDDPLEKVALLQNELALVAEQIGAQELRKPKLEAVN